MTEDEFWVRYERFWEEVSEALHKSEQQRAKLHRIIGEGWAARARKAQPGVWSIYCVWQARRAFDKARRGSVLLP